jgi:hypothetical protein
MPEVEDIEMADQSNEVQPKAPSVSRGSEASSIEEKSDTRNKKIDTDDLDMEFGLEDDKDQVSWYLLSPTWSH